MFSLLIHNPQNIYLTGTPNIEFFKVRYTTHKEKIENRWEIKLGDNDECPVCMEEDKTMIRCECGHVFCGECLLRIIKYDSLRCPLCRREQRISETKLRDELEEEVS